MDTKTDIWPFLKMHGLGNDFVVVDARTRDFIITPTRAESIANRKRGIGCDQLIILRKSSTADVFMEIWNADGSRVGACGNATRCVGSLILDETDLEICTIETDAGILNAVRAGDNISVNMGVARLNWDEIPLAHTSETQSVALSLGPISNPGCVNMGNPHAVFFVDDADSIDLATLGPQVEHHSLFPERVNASIATLKDGVIRLRVWERGAGITEACGTAACASVVAATRRGLINRSAVVALDGGDLFVEWLKDGTLQMTGPATHVFSGECLL